MNLRINIKFTETPELSKILALSDKGDISLNAELSSNTEPTRATRHHTIRTLIHQVMCMKELAVTYEEGEEKTRKLIDGFINTY